MLQAALFENEEIKQIENFPNYYVTTFGRVWSEHSHKFLKPTIDKRGNHQREYVSLGRGNKEYIHRLVANAFIPNPNNYDEIDHIDTNGLNNHSNNLRWTTHQQNMDNEITKEKIKQNTGYYCEIEEIATGKKFIGHKAASEYSGLHEETIRNHTKGKVKNPKWRLTGKRIKPED